MSTTSKRQADAAIPCALSRIRNRPDDFKLELQSVGDVLRNASQVRYISTRSERADAVLGGGFAQGQLVEVSGDCGSGKSQLCMTLAASALLQDDAARVLYCDGAGFAARRCQQILLASGADSEASMSRIDVFEPVELDSLARLVAALPDLYEVHDSPLRLVVIDGLPSAWMRDEATFLHSIFFALGVAARRLKFAGLATNVAIPCRDEEEFASSLADNIGACFSVRAMIDARNCESRQLSILKSSVGRNRILPFSIAEQGVVFL